MITLTLVRHGESTDNLKGIWAGWKDAPLSNHGLNQAKAVGEYFAQYPINAIYASPLKRALTTAQQIEKQNQSKPPLTITPLIREQHFGEAEGNPWAPSITPNPKGPNDPNATGRLGVIDPKTNKKVYPVQPGRSAKFPAGESQDDVAERTGEAFDEFVMPFVRKSVGKPAGEVNVLFVSHGIAISETIGAIYSRATNGRGVDPNSWSGGLRNTAWSRLVIGMEGEKLEYDGEELHVEVGSPHNEGVDDGEKLADAVESANPPTPEIEKREPRHKEIVVKVVSVNQYTHLDGVVRQKGGIGSMAHDDTQKAITDFFGGGGKSKEEKEKDAMDVDTSTGSNL
ncbi:hypothetical protein M407DRAFT_241045 [Tulasnella calospora MUT 4182]|uniref:Phosphoglycerate mutase n=1 Tax=Tulasnella calospora MUT 4182 TaxID=1051891 RepID=A0A0C3QV68_9AGAM|nr:hypothetical protein M407DRAFT_241045 [Tulasnella calospora MUT 4182]